MELKEVTSQITAYREALRKGELGELDLDALSDCLGEAIRAIETTKEDAESGRILKDDLISEVIRYSRAWCALVDGVTVFDSDKLREMLQVQDTKALLSIRRRVRTGFMRLLRSSDLPRRTIGSGVSPDEVADYRLGRVRS